MMSFRKWSAQLGMATLLLACGDDGKSPEGGDADKPRGAATDGKVGNSDPDTSVADLNEPEWTAACLDLGSTLNERDLAHGLCIISGVMAKFLSLDCMSTYEMCLTEPPDDTQCDSKPDNCTATLRELDACNVSQLLWLAEQTKDIDCSSSFNALTGIDQNHTTPECEVLKAKCPAFETAASEDSEETSF
jgi:hypothetical protein